MSSVSTCGMFSQILSIIFRPDFERHVRELKAERATKGFGWVNNPFEHHRNHDPPDQLLLALDNLDSIRRVKA